VSRHLLAPLLALLLSACAHGLPVHGKVFNSGEIFDGSAEGPGDGDGTVSLTSSKGVKCAGRYTHVGLGNLKVLGNLDLKCDDGRTGGAILTGDAKTFRGLGTLGDDVFILGE
jgi:hypothetical protein